jgi:1-deoxy-D-xylulose-5-phosphate synthase
MTPLPIGKSETLREGKDIAIIAIGSMVASAEAAAARLAEDRVEATVINARFIKPLDEEAILRLADSVSGIVTVEENATMGGFGSGILELLSARGKRLPTRVLGVPDRFFEHASQDRLRQIAGLDADSIVDAARGLLGIGTRGNEPSEDIRTPSVIS